MNGKLPITDPWAYPTLIREAHRASLERYQIAILNYKISGPVFIGKPDFIKFKEYARRIRKSRTLKNAFRAFLG